MIKLAILGFGKVGQTLISTIKDNDIYSDKFEVSGIWNRSIEKIKNHPQTAGIRIFNSLSEVESTASQFDLIVECAHPDIILHSGVRLLQESNLFLSSPSVLSHRSFHTEFVEVLKTSDTVCYLPIGASVGIWDVIRLDQGHQLKRLNVTMAKHPDSFKIEDKDIREKLERALQNNERTELIYDSIETINQLAPQNTNTMTIYNIGAGRFDETKRTGRLIADPSLKTHDISLEVETKSGLQLKLDRINPAGHGDVTGKATFRSFLHSLLHFDKGIAHNHFIFC